MATYTDMTALYHPTLVAFLKKENKELKEANECLLNQRKELGIENDEDLCCYEQLQKENEELKKQLEEKDEQWASVVNTATRKLQDKIDELELENDDCEIDNEEIEKIKQMDKLCESNMIGILGIEESDSEEDSELQEIVGNDIDLSKPLKYNEKTDSFEEIDLVCMFVESQEESDSEEEDPIEQLSKKGFADMCSEFPNGIPLNQMWKINTYDKKVEEESDEESEEELKDYSWNCLYCGEKGNPDECGIWVSERCRKEEHLGTENMKDHPECDYKGYICNGCQWYGEQMCFKCQDFNGAFTGLLLEQQ